MGANPMNVGHVSSIEAVSHDTPLLVLPVHESEDGADAQKAEVLAPAADTQRTFIELASSYMCSMTAWPNSDVFRIRAPSICRSRS